MAASQVEIVNIALQKCGETRISSMSQDTKAAREATSAWDVVRRSALRLNYWNFAKGRAELAPSAAAPLMGWTYQFPVPANFLALRGIFQDNTYQQQYTDITYEYVTESTDTQRVIMAEINPLFITYTKDVVDTAQFDPLFDQVLACHLAQQLVYPLSLSIDRLSSIQKECEYWTNKAKLLNAIENKPEAFKSSEWVDARFEGDTFLRRGPVA